MNVLFVLDTAKQGGCADRINAVEEECGGSEERGCLAKLHDGDGECAIII